MVLLYVNLWNEGILKILLLSWLFKFIFNLFCVFIVLVNVIDSWLIFCIVGFKILFLYLNKLLSVLFKLFFMICIEVLVFVCELKFVFSLSCLNVKLVLVFSLNKLNVLFFNINDLLEVRLIVIVLFCVVFFLIVIFMIEVSLFIVWFFLLSNVLGWLLVLLLLVIIILWFRLLILLIKVFVWFIIDVNFRFNFFFFFNI